jgi:glycosyltransferase involved in cell wall biosynthesis
LREALTASGPEWEPGDDAERATVDGGTIVIMARDIRRRDAVGSFCFQMQDLLAREGYRTKLAAENCDSEHRELILPIPRALSELGSEDVVIFHFSIEDPALPGTAAISNPKILYFHNITPASFYREVDEATADLVQRGLDQRPLGGRFDVLLANSKVSAAVLHAGLVVADRDRIAPTDIVVCPPFVGIDRWQSVKPVPIPLPAGDRLVLYVGRLQPHKAVDRLLEGFIALQSRDSSMALAIVGEPAASPYARQLKDRAKSLGRARAEHIQFYHGISDGALRFLYERAALCASMSGHEGFGVPVVDAIIFDKPLVISAEPAMMETAGDAAIVVGNSGSVAAAFAAALDDEAVRKELKAARQARLALFRKAGNGRIILDAVSTARSRFRARTL